MIYDLTMCVCDFLAKVHKDRHQQDSTVYKYSGKNRREIQEIELERLKLEEEAKRRDLSRDMKKIKALTPEEENRLHREFLENVENRRGTRARRLPEVHEDKVL